MSGPFSNEFTHGSFNEATVQSYIENEEFVSAFCTSMNLLSAALLNSPKSDDFTRALEILRIVDMPRDWPFGAPENLQTAERLLDKGAQETEQDLVVEYTRLFRGPAALPAPPWGSVYMDRDQVFYGWTWIELRRWLREHGIEGTYEDNDPEDNFARMLGLAGTIAEQKPGLLAEFLADHLLCWSPRFLELLEAACVSPTYQGLAALSRITLDGIQNMLGITPAARKMRR